MPTPEPLTDLLPTPKVVSATRRSGIAGQFAYDVSVNYGSTLNTKVTFVSNVLGGKIVMVTQSQPGGVFVDSEVTDRIGTTLTPEWIGRFFGHE